MHNTLADLLTCERCGLSKTRTQVVVGSGLFRKQVMLVGECPGEDEDLLGVPFVGKAGHKLFEVLTQLGLCRDDFYVTNAVRCRAVVDINGRLQNRNPNWQEISACRRWLMQDITRLQPSYVVLLGNTALRSILQSAEAKISNYRGHVFIAEGMRCFATFHPASLIYNPSLTEQFRADWKTFLRLCC